MLMLQFYLCDIQEENQYHLLSCSPELCQDYKQLPEYAAPLCDAERALVLPVEIFKSLLLSVFTVS